MEMVKPSFPDIHMCIIPAVEIMRLWQKKNITSVIQHPVMLWLEKIFLRGKNTTKHPQYNSAALTLKAYGEDRRWRKTYKEPSSTGLFSQPLTVKAQERLNSHIKESGNHFLI